MTEKLKWLFLALVTTGAVHARCEPTYAELQKAAAVVQSRLARERRLYATGTLSREQVGDAAMREANRALNDAERALMLTGATVFYAKARVSGKAVEAFRRLRTVLSSETSRDVDGLLASVEACLAEETRAILRDSLSTVWWCRSVPAEGYWNMELSDFRFKLKANESNGRLHIQPLSQMNGFVDLTKRLLPEDGRELVITSVGDHLESYGKIPHAAWRWDERSPRGTLTGVALPDTLEAVFASAFEGCSKMKTISLPDGVWTTCRRSFAGCTGLREIRLPSRLTTICGEAFRGCASLRSVEIPASVTNIRTRAFADCSTLRQVRFLGCETCAANDAFRGSPCDADIRRVPKKKTSEPPCDFCPESSRPW